MGRLGEADLLLPDLVTAANAEGEGVTLVGGGRQHRSGPGWRTDRRTGWLSSTAASQGRCPYGHEDHFP
jgi:hypothetical protein